MKNSSLIKFLSYLLLCICLVFGTNTYALADENKATDVFDELFKKLYSPTNQVCTEVGAELERYEKLFLRDCSPPNNLMNEMINSWQKYYKLEQERLNTYESFVKDEAKYLTDFNLSEGSQSKYYNMYLELKEEARKAGLLIEGIPPWLDPKRRAGIELSKSEFAFEADADKYFYFGDSEQNKSKIKQLQDKLEEIKTQYNQGRTAYKDFFNKMGTFAKDEVDSRAKEMLALREGYIKNAKALSELAFSEEYEHCLGKIKKGSSVIVDMGLYNKAEPGTVDAIPGMGLKFFNPTEIKITLANIPDFPLTLNLKKDGTEARRYVLELLKLQKENASRKSIETGNKIADNILSFGFDTAYFAIEPIAKLEYAMLDFAKHPIKSTTDAGKATVKFLDEVAGIKFEDWKIKIDPTKDATRTIAEAVEKEVLDAKKKLGDLGVEVALNLLESDRFKVKPGDAPYEELRKMREEIESIQKINDGLQVLAKATAEIGSALTGEALTKGFKAIDLSKKGITLAEIEQASLSVGAKTKKAEALLDKISEIKTKKPSVVKTDIAKEADALKAIRTKVDDTATKLKSEQRIIDATKTELDDATKARHQAIADDLAKTEKEVTTKVDDLAKQNDEAQKAIQQAVSDDVAKKVNEPIEKPFKGVKTEVKEEMVVKKPDGTEVKLQLGEQLGKGSTSKAFVDAQNDAFVIRQTLLDKKGEIATKLDDYGRNVIENEIKSDSIRMAKRQEVYKADPADFFDSPKRIEIVERVPTTADKMLQAQGGQLTQGQKLAFEQAMRDLNNKGYAWLDNHFGNFTFEQLPGTDRWRVVVIDSGNIVKMRGATLEEMVKNAKEAQKAIEEVNRVGVNVDNQLERLLKHKEVVENVDLQALNLQDASSLGFNMNKGQRPDLTGISNLTDEELSKILKNKTDDAIKALTSGTDNSAEEALKRKASAGFDDKAPEINAQAVEELNKQANIRELIQKCAEYIKLRNSGYDPEKLKKMLSPCQAIGI